MYTLHHVSVCWSEFNIVSSSLQMSSWILTKPRSSFNIGKARGCLAYLRYIYICLILNNLNYLFICIRYIVFSLMGAVVI